MTERAVKSHLLPIRLPLSLPSLPLSLSLIAFNGWPDLCFYVPQPEILLSINVAQ
jgi:hypothetical protein